MRHVSLATSAGPSRQATLAQPHGAFRTDIQGLRAIAVGLVLLYHANVTLFSGGFVGVDMFFVISGFLITGLMIREVDKTGRIDLATFYAKRIRRILPAATVVLVVTLLLTVLILPPIRWTDIAVEAGAAALYVANWVFAAGTGYQNAGLATSPLQHFWTLSVEEQFYIVWPLVMILALMVARRRGRASLEWFRRMATIGIVAVMVPSFVWSVYYTATSPAPAYFVTTTRLWELAIGAALALTAHRLEQIPRAIGVVLGWVGLAVLLGVSVTYTATAPLFPGVSALLPTLATAALIIAGMSGRAQVGVGRLLSVRPMRWVGDISYSLYLWHWPLIVFATFLVGGSLSPIVGLFVCAVSFVPSWLSYRFVEEPFRDWETLKRSKWRAIRIGGVMIVATCVVAAGTITVAKAVGDQQVVAQNPLGARVLTEDVANDDLSSFGALGAPVDMVEEGIAPAAMEARKDNAQYYGDGNCHVEFDGAQPTDCVFGDPDGEFQAVLAGDSHAANWAPALIEIAEREGWGLRVHTKSGCAFALVEQTRDGNPYTECSQWTESVYDEITGSQPDVLVTSNAGRRGVIEQGEVLPEGEKEGVFQNALEETWAGVSDAGVDVVVIADTPEMGKDVADCVSANPTKLTKCATPRDEALNEIPRPEIDAVEEVSSVKLIEMDNWVCPDADTCPAVVGNTLVWRDSHHLTRTYSESLTEPLAEKLAAVGVIN